MSISLSLHRVPLIFMKVLPPMLNISKSWSNKVDAFNSKVVWNTLFSFYIILFIFVIERVQNLMEFIRISTMSAFDILKGKY